MTDQNAPYYAVIFTSQRSNKDDDAYSEMAIEMVRLAEQQPGFLGVESARSEIGITVSYWKDMESIIAWKKNSAHLVAQKKGREEWYQNYHVRICRVEREYGLPIL